MFLCCSCLCIEGFQVNTTGYIKPPFPVSLYRPFLNFSPQDTAVQQDEVYLLCFSPSHPHPADDPRDCSVFLRLHCGYKDKRSSQWLGDKYFSNKKDVMCQYHKLRQTVLVPCRDGCHWLCLWLWLRFLGYPGRNHMPLPVQHDRLDHCSLLSPDLRRQRVRTQLCDHDGNETICQIGKLTQTVPFICYNRLLG